MDFLDVVLCMTSLIVGSNSFIVELVVQRCAVYDLVNSGVEQLLANSGTTTGRCV